MYSLYDNMLSQTHLLVSGATGSGKSVVINGIIYNGLSKSPDDFSMVLIDTKRVELSAYKYLPHCIRYASEPEDIVPTLEQVMSLVDARYNVMATLGLKKWNSGDIYVIIDEFADLMTTNRKQVQPLIQRLCQIGRGASVHCIIGTQTPISKVLPTEIKVNFDSRVGLRTRSAQDSRNILGMKGCETLPRYGEGYYMTPESIVKCDIPMYTDDEIQEVIDYWMAHTVYVCAPQKTGFFGKLRSFFGK